MSSSIHLILQVVSPLFFKPTISQYFFISDYLKKSCYNLQLMWFWSMPHSLNEQPVLHQTNTQITASNSQWSIIQTVCSANISKEKIFGINVARKSIKPSPISLPLPVNWLWVEPCACSKRSWQNAKMWNELILGSWHLEKKHWCSVAHGPAHWCNVMATWYNLPWIPQKAVMCWKFGLEAEVWSCSKCLESIN